MTDPTPRGMLTMFRQKSDTFSNEQAEMFNKMPLKERLELLFYMMLHANKITRYLHDKIEPGEAEIIDMPEPEKGH